MEPTEDGEIVRMRLEYREAVYASIQAALAVATTRKDFEAIAAQCESIAGYRDADDILRDARRKMQLLGRPPQPEVDTDAGGARAAAGHGRWARLKAMLRKGCDKAVQKANEAWLFLRILLIRWKCALAFHDLGKELYRKGEALLAEALYQQKIERLRALHAEIEQCRGEIEALRS